jgi:hypothetical protein
MPIRVKKKQVTFGIAPLHKTFHLIGKTGDLILWIGKRNDLRESAAGHLEQVTLSTPLRTVRPENRRSLQDPELHLLPGNCCP